MEKNDNLIQFYEKYVNTIANIENEDLFASFFYNQVASGVNKVSQINIDETKSFDEEWIRTIESYFPSLNKIISNPKSALKYEEEIIEIEKAKRINSNSIRHLASHTQLIKEVRQDGLIMPKKILTTHSDVHYGIYENRFIMTLIDRLFQFVRTRYEAIKNNYESFQKKHLNIASSFPINETEVDIKIDVTIKQQPENNKINEYNLKLLERVENLNKLITSLKQSPFMETMSREKKVVPPIMKTQVILKNVDYKNAYMLWLFLDRYNTLAFTIDIKEKNLDIDNAYIDDLYRNLLTTFVTFEANQQKRRLYYQNIQERHLRRKSFKTIKKSADDFLIKPEDDIMEAESMNQYYLEEIKKMFKKSVEYHESQTKTEETSLKRALRDTINITNALYESFFDLNDEQNVFNRLIKDADPVKKIRDAKQKAKIAKLIREVKQVDYNDALRLERKYLKQIEEANKEILESVKNNRLITAKSLKSEKQLEKDLILNKKKQEIVREKLAEARKLEKDLEKEKNAQKEILNAYKEKIKAEEKEALKALRKQYLEKRRKALEDINLKHQKELAKIRAKRIKEKAHIKENIEKERIRLSESHSIKIEKEEENLKNKNQEIIEETKKILEEKRVSEF